MRAAASGLAVALVAALAACGGGSGSGVAAGKAKFLSEGCGSCHTVAEAGTTGELGPVLAETLEADATTARMPLEEFVRASILEPDSFVNPRHLAGTMPTNYGDRLTEDEIDGLVAFLVDVATS
jgi:cytochrome c oxidase subunit II